jgi:hypothetical protein
MIETELVNLQEEAKKKEDGIKTESVAISTEDPMETIEEENNTPHSLNRSFSFVRQVLLPNADSLNSTLRHL